MFDVDDFDFNRDVPMIMGRRADINVNPKRNATNIEFMLNEMSLKPRLDLIILGRCDGSPFGYIFVLDNS